MIHNPMVLDDKLVNSREKKSHLFFQVNFHLVPPDTCKYLILIYLIFIYPATLDIANIAQINYAKMLYHLSSNGCNHKHIARYVNLATYYPLFKPFISLYMYSDHHLMPPHDKGLP